MKEFQMVTVSRASLKKALVFTLFSTTCAINCGFAMAQSTAPAQSTANPARVEEQFPLALKPTDTAPPVVVRPRPAQAAPKGAEKVTFTLRDLKIEGASVYSEQELAALSAGDIGHKISLARLYDIAGEMTLKYRNDGYILTQVVIPPQHIAGGVARLRVVEGYVDQVHIEGGRDSERGLIESYASHIANNGPLNVHDMERSLLLINDLPGVKARSILSPSKTKVGAADLTVIIDRKPYNVQLDANNFGTKYLGPYQLGAAAALNSLLGQNERITAQVVYAPGAHMNSELMYYALGYAQPVGPYGTTLSFNYSHSDTDPGFHLKQFEVDGLSDFIAVTVDHPFIRSRQLNVNGHITFDARDVQTVDNIEPTRNDKIRTVRVGGKVEYLDTLFGRAAFNTGTLEITRGLGVFDASDSRDANTSRPGADDGFTKFNAELQRLQRIIPSVNLLVGVTGQQSNDELFSSEEFGLGGQGYGRGYDPSEVIGDRGVAGKLEAQWEDPVHFNFVNNWQTYGFYDIGQVWTKNSTTLADKRNSLASTGLGLRGTFTAGTGVEAYVAFPLTRDVATQSGRNPRFFLGLNQKF
jgi:hemolysin activation/secretion protein